MSDGKQDAPVVIKKYANRRLYNTETSSYVTLEYLADMIQDGRDFKVIDAKSGDDITRSVLTQIIVEQESKGQTLLPLGFLRQLIGFYGQGMEKMVPQYLEASMTAFAAQQDQIRDYFSDKIVPREAMSAFDELARQNMAMFEQATRMFTGGLPTAKPAEKAGPAGGQDDIDALKAQLAAMQDQLDKLSKT